MKIEVLVKNNSFGVYATDFIFKNEKIFNISERFAVADHPTKYSVQIDIKKHIEELHSLNSLSHPESFWRYLNHSCNPNAWFKIDEMTLYALQDIHSGEHITFNYLTTEYEMASPFICGCGSERCFKNIRGFKYLDDKQKELIFPFAADHIKRIFNKDNILQSDIEIC